MMMVMVLVTKMVIVMVMVILTACLCFHPTLTVSSNAVVNSTEIISGLIC